MPSLAQFAALKKNIQAEAARLGFAFCGVTHTAPPPHASIFEHWLSQGRHASMNYLSTPRSRERRSAPALILPAAKAILSLAIPYALPSALPAAVRADPARGQIAAYAWGQDYHDILLPRLERLSATLAAQLNTPLRHLAYTDTGPILERDLAQRAGLGWIGKNTCLIHPQHGSYFLLAEVFLDVPLEPDPPFSNDLCGRCARCIAACPTHCIQADRTIDARRCLSYLTIENKEAIPHDLRSHTGNWIFGCDICQMACPWNQRFADLTPDRELRTPADIPAPLLLEELNLTAEQFQQRFRGSPVLRAKRRGYLRNVAVALGNTHDPAAANSLIHCLTSEPETLVRAHAAWALGQIQTPLARRALEKALQQEPEDSVRFELRSALEMGPI